MILNWLVLNSDYGRSFKQNQIKRKLLNYYENENVFVWQQRCITWTFCLIGFLGKQEKSYFWQQKCSLKFSKMSKDENLAENWKSDKENLITSKNENLSEKILMRSEKL